MSAKATLEVKLLPPGLPAINLVNGQSKCNFVRVNAIFFPGRVAFTLSIKPQMP